MREIRMLVQQIKQIERAVKVNEITKTLIIKLNKIYEIILNKLSFEEREQVKLFIFSLDTAQTDLSSYDQRNEAELFIKQILSLINEKNLILTEEYRESMIMLSREVIESSKQIDKTKEDSIKLIALQKEIDNAVNDLPMSQVEADRIYDYWWKRFRLYKTFVPGGTDLDFINNI